MDNIIYLLLGGNMGDRMTILLRAIKMIEESSGSVVAQSSFYQTAAWGKADQQDFLNIAIGIRTDLNPQHLLKAIQKTESQLGRQRTVLWGERTIDIDIIFYKDAVVNDPNLIIPHPLMAERRFVLQPLCEIAASAIHPVLHKSVEQLLLECTDELPVVVYNVPATI